MLVGDVSEEKMALPVIERSFHRFISRGKLFQFRVLARIVFGVLAKYADLIPAPADEGPGVRRAQHRRILA